MVTMIKMIKTAQKTAAELLCIAAVFGVSGCGQDALGTENRNTPTPDGQAYVVGTESTWEEMTDTSVFGWQDNTSDLYTCISKTILPVENQEKLDEYYVGGEILSGTMWGRLCAYREKDADRLEGETLYLINEAGDVKSIPISSLNESISGEIFMKAGSTVDGTGCVLATNNYSQDMVRSCEIAVLDSEGELLQPLVTAQDISVWNLYDRYDSFIADENGNIYFAGNSDGEEKGAYMVLDKDGNLIFSKEYSGSVGLQVLPDGRIAACTREKTAEGICVQLRDIEPESSDAEVLAEWRGNAGNDPDCMTLSGEDVLLVADRTGVYQCGIDGKTEETLYAWENHGIHIDSVKHMTVDENGTIRVLYYMPEPDRENPQIPVLVCLQPTMEKRQMLEIDFAVSSRTQENYEQAVVSFYESYPNCKVNLVTYEDESRLLTELIAGEGPVLVDTSLISFAANKELWECLDKRLEDSDLEGVFIEKLLETGQIDGSQYGLSLDWYLMTFAGNMEEIRDWNQREFLKYLEEHPEITTAYGNQTPMDFLIYFFFLDEKDSIFVDLEEGRAYFDSEEFTELMEIAKRLAGETEPEEPTEDFARMKEGTRLGTQVEIFQPEDLGLLEAMSGSDLNYIGYPGAEGSRHYIMAASPITIRAGAEEWEKQAAMAFLEVLFSYDTQLQLQNINMSARADVFMEQIDNMSTSTSCYVNGEIVPMEIDTGKTKEHILQLCEKGTIYPMGGSVLKDMILEELSAYFNGTASAADAAAILQNRAQLYLDENEN